MGGGVDAALVLAVVAILAFAFTNGFHDAANAIATLVATRGARPGPAIILAAVCNMLGPLLLGAAVADTIAGIVEVTPAQTVIVVGAALTAAVTWNLLTWRWGLPSSSSHALVGGLVGAAVVEAGPGAVNWGGVGGGHPTGVVGVLVALAISPVLGFGAAWLMERGVRRWLRRVTSGANRPVLRSVAAMAALLADGARHLATAFERLNPGRRSKGGPGATDAADAAVKTKRQLERVYRQAASALLEVQDLREVMGRRELYRRVSRISETLIQVADRVWYATVKEG